VGLILASAESGTMARLRNIICPQVRKLLSLSLRWPQNVSGLAGK
jgi:hypothetical protein